MIVRDCGQQEDGILHGTHRMPLARNLDQVTSTAVPRLATCVQHDPTFDDQDARLAGILVLLERSPRAQSDQRLPHGPFVAADDCPARSIRGRSPSILEQFAG